MTRARDVADTQDNLGGAVAPFVAGKNAVINGGFDIWQRGTTFTNPGTGQTFTTDRWSAYMGNGTVTQDTTLVNPGSRYGARITATASSNYSFLTIIETANSLPLAGRTVTLSGYYAGTPGINPGVILNYSTNVDDSLFNINTAATLISQSVPTVTGSFQRFTATYALSSTAKTLRIAVDLPSLTNTNFVTLSNIQLEIGSIATPFARAGGSIGGELALCQRYYWRTVATSAFGIFAFGMGTGSTTAVFPVNFPTTMRIAPTSIDFANLQWNDTTNGNTISTLTIDNANPQMAKLNATSPSAITNLRPTMLFANNNTSGYLGLSAEL
jgi:hypothetical protein